MAFFQTACPLCTGAWDSGTVGSLEACIFEIIALNQNNILNLLTNFLGSFQIHKVPRLYIYGDLGWLDILMVSKWLAHLPFTSETAGSSLSENFLNATRTQSSFEKSKSQRSAESRGFPPGTPVSSHRESWQGGLGKKGPQ
jgi:hypothetical protein